MVLTDAHHALIANARRAFATDPTYAVEIATDARTMTPVKAPRVRGPKVVKDAAYYREHRKNRTPAQIEKERLRKRAYFLRRKGELASS